MKLPRVKVPYWQIIAIPLLLWFLGAGMNQMVLIANWGKFPVMFNDYQVTLIKSAQRKACEPAPPKQDELPFWLRQGAPTPKSSTTFSMFDTSVATSPVCEAINQNGQFTDNVHTIMGHNSHLKFLADIFDMGPMIFSFGDFLIMLGEYLGEMAGLAWLVLIIRKFNEVAPHDSRL